MDDDTCSIIREHHSRSASAGSKAAFEALSSNHGFSRQI